MKLLLFLFASLAYGQPTAVSVETTQTQAVLRYTSPDAAVCTVKVSEESDLSPLVHDVDPSIFANSDDDDRYAANSGVTRRVFVVGKRTSGVGADGKLHSRALAQNTLHYYEVTCTGGSATGTFLTRTIGWNDLKPEAPPMNASGFGRAAWPTIDWTNRTRWYVDPMTGLKYKPLGYPSDYAWTYPSDGGQFLFGTDRTAGGTGWTNTANLRSGTTGSVATTSNTNAIFVGIDPSVTVAYGYSVAGIAGEVASVDNLQVQVYGSGTDATASNRQVNLCWSLDWATCHTATVTVTMPSGSDASVGGFPDDSTFKSNPFFNGWTTPISRLNLARAGTVNTSGTAVTWASGDTFDQDWAAGARVWINGTLATVASVSGPISMVVSENLGTQTGVDFEFGAALMIAKTNATGSINISVGHKVATSMTWNLPPGGSFDACSYVKTTASVDRDGNASAAKTGQMCVVEGTQSGSGGIYWVADDGETRLISVFRYPTSVQNSVDPDDQPNQAAAYPALYAPFSPTVGTRWYTQMKCSAAGTYRCIFQLDYVGDFREWRPSPRYPAAAGTQPSSPSDNVEWTNLTLPSAGRDLDSLVAAGYPAYEFSRWGTLASGATTAGVTGTYFALYKVGWDASESPVSHTFVFSTTDGAFVRGWDTYTGTLSEHFRWSGHHATFALGTGSTAGYVFQSLNPNRQTQGGYTATTTHIWRSGAWSADSSLPSSYDASYDGTCPANDYGATSNNCFKLRINREPCKTVTLANEATWFPCPSNGALSSLSNIEVGDIFGNSGALSAGERFRVLAITKNSESDIELTVQRGIIPTDVPTCVTQQAHSDNWVIEMHTGGGRACDVNSLMINVATGDVYASAVLDHFDVGTGPTTELRWVSASYSYADGGLAQLNTTAPPLPVANNPGFAAYSPNGIPPMQSYPSNRQFTAPASEKTWSLNHRHLTDWGPQTLTQVSGNLYTIATLGTTDVKRSGWIVNASGTLLTELNPGTTGDTITPSDTWRYCYAYRNNECRTGSSAGTMYVVVPSPASAGSCGEFSLSSRAVCAYAPGSLGAWGIQEISTLANSNGRWVRRLSMQPGPQRHPSFENWRPIPDGKMAIWRSAWTDGLYTTTMLAQLPPVRLDGTSRGTWQHVAVQIGSGVVTNDAIVRFWYDEFDGYCSSRQEHCYATATAVTEATPYLFAHEFASDSGPACASGCTVTIPATSGRVLYYQVYNNASGVLTAVGEVEEVAVK